MAVLGLQKKLVLVLSPFFLPFLRREKAKKE
jgi:hypothetical protein